MPTVRNCLLKLYKPKKYQITKPMKKIRDFQVLPSKLLPKQPSVCLEKHQVQ